MALSGRAACPGCPGDDAGPGVAALVATDRGVERTSNGSTSAKKTAPDHGCRQLWPLERGVGDCSSVSATTSILAGLFGSRTSALDRQLTGAILKPLSDRA